MSNLVEEGYDFFNFFKGGNLQKSLGNPVLGNHILSPKSKMTKIKKFLKFL